jgi:hypothetical protein
MAGRYRKSSGGRQMQHGVVTASRRVDNGRVRNNDSGDPGGRKMVVMRSGMWSLAALAGLAMVLAAMPAEALTMQECSAKYQAAKTAGTLGGQNWAAFRKAQCGEEATATSAAKPVAATAAVTRPAAAGSAVFPSAIAPKYAKEKPSKARMHTCVDQYNANKTANANGGLKWIQKGGGYYSECNKRLKS